MANAGQALAKALGVFTETYVDNKQKQLDDENEARIRNFYMNQAEKQEERARAAEQRSIEDQKRQEMVYDQALAAKRTEREAMLSQMAKMGISGTPEELAARVDIENLTREERQRKEEATKRAERETASKNTRYLSLVAEEVPQEMARKIADMEAMIEKGQDTPELRAAHADLMKQGGEVSVKAKAALLESVKPPEVSRVPDGIRAELAAALGSTPEGQARLARFREIEGIPDKSRTHEMLAEYDSILGSMRTEEDTGISLPDTAIMEIASNAARLGKIDKFLEFQKLINTPKSKQTPEWQAQYATIVGELTPDEQGGGDLRSQIGDINAIMDELAKSGGAVKDIATGEYGEPADPAARAKWSAYKAQKDQLLGLPQTGPKAQDAAAQTISAVGSTTGRPESRLVARRKGVPGSEIVFDSQNPDELARVGSLILKDTTKAQGGGEPAWEFLDGNEHVKTVEDNAKGTSAFRQFMGMAADSSIIAKTGEGIGKTVKMLDELSDKQPSPLERANPSSGWKRDSKGNWVEEKRKPLLFDINKPATWFGGGN